MLPFALKMAETILSAERFPPDLFCTIDPWHGSTVQKIFIKETTINRRAHGE
jgi:hypothetical protein